MGIEFENLASDYGVFTSFFIEDYVKSCKGLSMVDFEKYNIWASQQLENIILNSKEDFLKRNEDKIGALRVFFGKASNYVKTGNSVVPPKNDDEKRLLDELRNNIKLLNI